MDLSVAFCLLWHLLLISWLKLLERYFNVESVTFKNTDNKDFESPLVFCSDVCGFVETLAYLRGYNFTDMVEKVGMDSGKGHLRLVLTLYDEEDLLDFSTGSRVTRQEGIGSSCHYKLTGRKKIMILASVPKVPESYVNCSIIMNKVNINSLAYKFTGDLKIMNILAGLMSASSKCPCVYCEVGYIQLLGNTFFFMRTSKIGLRLSCS